jgi:very-short-patch-repair endonuclease
MVKTETRQRNEKFRRDLIERATPQELKVKSFLESRGVHFMFQKGLLVPFHRIVDFYIPGSKTKRLIIEIDGGCHNDTKAKDANKDRSALSQRSMPTLRITNAQVDNGEFVSILTKRLAL